MQRYYVLTRRDGLKVVEASAVDEFHPFTVRFVNASVSVEFERHELLWWSPVEAAAPAPYSNFDHFNHPGKYPAGVAAYPGHGPGRAPREHATKQAKPDPQELTCAAMEVLAAVLQSRMPKGWRKVRLELKVTYIMLPGRYKIAHRIRNPDNGSEVMDFSDALFAAIDVYHRLHVEAGQYWNESSLTISRDAAGSTIQARHTYGNCFAPALTGKAGKKPGK